jgi:hypothetical protein
MRYSPEDGKPFSFIGPDAAHHSHEQDRNMGASNRENTDGRPANCRFRLMDEGKAYLKSSCQGCGANIDTGLGNSCKVFDQKNKLNGLNGLVATADVSFNPSEIKQLIIEFLAGRGLKGISQNDITFNVHQGSSDPREPYSPGLTSVNVKVKLG